MRKHIDLNWRCHAETSPTEYQVKWTQHELRLFGDIEEIGGETFWDWVNEQYGKLVNRHA